MPSKTDAPFVSSVLHATDFSPASERAFAHALAVAIVRRASLTLLHVAADAHGDWRRFPAVRKTLERWKLLPPGSAQEDVFDALGVSVTKAQVSSRFPARAVSGYLEAHPADLLVVATEGREGAARWLHGSAAEAMARRSHTMTLFVPDDAPRSLVALADGSLTADNLLVPVDHSPDPGSALEFARRVAEIGGDGHTRITLLHVGEQRGAPWLRADGGPGWKFEPVCRPGEPVDQIAACAEEIAANLIVMPTEGRAGVFEALRGSTTERVLRRAGCPVLAVPAHAS